MINQAARVDTPDGPVFVKWNDSPPSCMLHEEAHGLEAIKSTNTLRVPDVIGYHDPGSIEHEQDRWPIRPPQYLVLEFIEQRSPPNAKAFAERFGALLARMHREEQKTSG